MKNIFIKKKNNKVLIVIGMVLIVGISSFIVINKSIKNGKLVQNDKKVVEKIKVDDFNEITVVSSRIEKTSKLANIYVKIKNNTKEVIDKSNLKLTIYDKDNNILLVSNIENIKKLKVGDEVEFQVSTTNDISNASKYVVEKINNE